MTTGGGPSVSVVIPTRNRTHLLPRAMASALAQTFPDFELLVIDDGSADDTSAVRAAFADPRVVWIDGPHTGVSMARNLGIARARGTWVAFLDDDNEWLPEYLERQMATARAEDADVVYCLGTEDRPGDVPRRQPPPPSPDPVVSFTRDWCPFTSCVMVRRAAVLRAGGFPPHLSQSEDRYLWLRLALEGRWAHTPEVLMVRHSHGGSRLSEDQVAVRTADAEIERTYGPAVRRRVGLLSAMRFFWHYRGRNEYRTMLARARTEGRRAAWESLVALAPTLPRSASTIWRPIAVLVCGPRVYTKARDGYARLHSALALRRRP